MRLHISFPVVEVHFEDGESLKLDSDRAVQPGSYDPEDVPDPVGIQLAQYFTTGRREEILREHGRIRRVDIIPYQPIDL